MKSKFCMPEENKRNRLIECDVRNNALISSSFSRTANNIIVNV